MNIGSFLSEKLKMLSFILTVLVVFIHAYTYKKITPFELFFLKDNAWEIEEFVSYGIARIAVPLFFIISGYLFFLNFNCTLQEIVYKLKRRSQTLLIPYLFWSLYGLLFYLSIQAIPKLGKFFTKELIRDYSIPKLLNTIFINPIPYQLWFLRDLMILVILSPVIYYLVKNLKWFVILLFSVIWFSGISLVVISTESLLYFTVGAFFALIKPNIKYQLFLRYSYYIAALWGIVIVTRLICIKLHYITEFENMLLYKIAISIGLLSLWLLYDKLFGGKDVTLLKIAKLLPYSFFIYLFHEPLLNVVKKIIIAVVGKSATFTLIIYFCSAIITIVLCILIGYLFKRFLRPVYAFSTGNR
jgi:surface polysaccharide O-acyltransferase-like enzyme